MSTVNITAVEQNRIAIAIQIDSNNQPITYPVVSELGKALSVIEKIDSTVNKDAEGGPTYTDADIELSTEERQFISDRVKNRQWTVGDAKAVLSLVEKLK